MEAFGWTDDDLMEAALLSAHSAGKGAEEALLIGSAADTCSEVHSILCQVAKDAGFQGRVEAYGSQRSGFRTGGSDIDMVYIPGDDEVRNLTPTIILQRFTRELQLAGFHSMVKVFTAAMPLLKAVGPNGADVDICVGNELGFHNSRLMQQYASLDERVTQVGQNIKHWAKFFDIAYVSDGHLSSYAYTLMTIYYLMYTDPPVLPNLQDLSARVDDSPVKVKARWGCPDVWDCQFFTDIDLIPRTQNKQTACDLTAGFFDFYGVFDWQYHAVSIRLAKTADLKRGHPLKEVLASSQSGSTWYIEDPFDLKHNLAALTTAPARQRIIEKMHAVRLAMRNAPQAGLAEVFWKDFSDAAASCFLKSRVQLDQVSKESFMEHFRDCPVVSYYWACGFSGRAEAFLKFATEQDRRIAHALNESYIGGWQVRLMMCSAHALEDASSELGIVFEEIKDPFPDDYRRRRNWKVPNGEDGKGGDWYGNWRPRARDRRWFNSFDDAIGSGPPKGKANGDVNGGGADATKSSSKAKGKGAKKSGAGAAPVLFQ